MSRVRRIGSSAMCVGILCILLGAWVGSAGAGGEGESNFQDAPGFTVTATRSYDGQTDVTMFTFTLDSGTGERASHIVLASCPDGTAPISSSGPNGQQPASENVADKSKGAGDHVGVKYDPGTLGTYTVTYAGDVAAAQIIVKNGPGHKHFYYGSPCTDGVQATTTTTSGPPPNEQEGPEESTTTTTGETPQQEESEESTTTTTSAADVGGEVEESTTTTTGGADVGIGQESTTTTAGPAETDPGVEPSEERGPATLGDRTDVSPTATLPRTGGAATGSALVWAGIALVLGGFTLRFAGPQV